MPLEARGLSKLSTVLRLGAVHEMPWAPSGPGMSCPSLLLPP